jgi:flagellin
LKTEIQRIAQVSAFNRTVLTTSAAANTGISFYVGADVAKSGNTVTFMGANTAASGGLDFNLDQTGTDVGTSSELKNILDATATTGASAAILKIDTALASLAGKRSEAGALVNRLEHTVSNLMNVSQRLQEAVSGIEDADYAAESAALARGMVLAQAGTAMLAQANQAPNFILALLRG